MATVPAVSQEEMRATIDSYLNRCVIDDSYIEAGLRELEPTEPDASGMRYERHQFDGTYTVTLHLRKKEAK